MGLFSKILASASGPTAEEISAKNHTLLVEWGLSHVIIRGDARILALGLGDGTDLEMLMSLAFVGKVTGIDSSAASVEKAKETNQWAITERKCSIVQGSAASLPFEADSFDFATAFEPGFFSSGTEAAFSEVRRVLKKGGSFLLVSGSDDPNAFKADELRRLFRDADFSVV